MGKKQFRGAAARARQPESKPAPAPTGVTPNLGFFKAARVHTRGWENAQIVLAGCGGIGVWMAMHISRLMRVLYESNKGVNFTLCDPDLVEEKNLGRQWFCDADVGQPKALAVARRLGGAFGLNTMAVCEPFDERFLVGADLTVVVGCVDNAAARSSLAQVLARNEEYQGEPPAYWWLDCGNNHDAGRVLLGSAHTNRQMRGAFVDAKHCVALPSPALQFPSLLVPAPEESGREMSCAEMVAANLQSLNINAAVAVQAADMLTRLLVTEDLKRYACAINVEAGAVKSYYVTPEQVAHDIGKTVEYVTAPTPELTAAAAPAALVA
jgi:PRTRC genetic system ThiF family protein